MSRATRAVAFGLPAVVGLVWRENTGASPLDFVLISALRPVLPSGWPRFLGLCLVEVGLSVLVGELVAGGLRRLDAPDGVCVVAGTLGAMALQAAFMVGDLPIP